MFPNSTLFSPFMKYDSASEGLCRRTYFARVRTAARGKIDHSWPTLQNHVKDCKLMIAKAHGAGRAAEAERSS
eukprot:2993893-Pleurochrysis_carterae.AAC.2